MDDWKIAGVGVEGNENLRSGDGQGPRTMFLLAELAVLAAVLFYPFFFHQPLFNLGTAKVYPCDFVYAVFFGYVLYKMYAEGLRGRHQEASWRWFTLYLAVCVAGLMRGAVLYGHAAVGESRLYLLPVLFYFVLLFSTPGDEQLRAGSKRLFWGILLFIPINAVLYITVGRAEDADTRYRFLTAPEALAVSFCALGLYVRHCLVEESARRIGRALLLTALLGVIAMAQVRSVWVATCIALVGLTVILGNRRAVLSLAAGCGFCLAAYQFLLPEDARSKIEEDFLMSGIFLSDYTEDGTAGWRIVGWDQELEEFWKSPVIGRGLGGYSQWFDGHEWQRVAVHNGYIMALSKFGLLGTGVLAVGLLAWFREAWRNARLSRVAWRRQGLWICQGCVLSHLVFAVFYDVTAFFWLLLAAGTLIGRGVAAESEEGFDIGEGLLDPVAPGVEPVPPRFGADPGTPSRAPR